MVRKKKHGKATKKARLVPEDVVEEQFKGSPHTFVFSRGNVGKNVTHLVRDVRRVMEPYTATNLKARRNNVLKDFVSVAGMLHVTHFLAFSKTEETMNMRIMRLPRGPTLTFRLHSYCLAKDILSSLKRPNVEEKQFLQSPLLVMNNFTGEGMHFKLMTSMFQNMFPSINVNKAKLKHIKRCLLMNYNEEDKTIDVRHFNIKAVPAGMSRGVKKLIKSKIPNMGKYENFEEYLAKGGDASESEAEQDGPHNVIVLPQNMPGKGNIASAKSAIRLTEMGPRLKLQLIKIEEGICTGEVLFHEFLHKTEEELAEQKKLREKKKQLKALRKKEQEENVEKKTQEKEKLKRKAIDGMKKKEVNGEEEKVESEEDDDVEYFKEAVGENPDPELFSGNKMKRRRSSQPKLPFKKKKFSNDARSSKDSFDSDSKFNRKGGKPMAKGFKGKGKKQPMDNFKKFGKGKSPGKSSGKSPGKSFGKGGVKGGAKGGAKGGRRGPRRQPGKQKQGRKK